MGILSSIGQAIGNIIGGIGRAVGSIVSGIGQAIGSLFGGSSQHARSNNANVCNAVHSNVGAGFNIINPYVGVNVGGHYLTHNDYVRTNQTGWVSKIWHYSGSSRGYYRRYSFNIIGFIKSWVMQFLEGLFSGIREAYMDIYEEARKNVEQWAKDYANTYYENTIEYIKRVKEEYKHSAKMRE